MRNYTLIPTTDRPREVNIGHYYLIMTYVILVLVLLFLFSDRVPHQIVLNWPTGTGIKRNKQNIP